jgi:hypothetical protein
MRIGELSERTGTPRRLLCWYDEQGLITPERCANGYRSYDERLVDRVQQIRALPRQAQHHPLPRPDAGDAGHAGARTRRMTRRIDFLARNRDAIAASSKRYAATVALCRTDKACCPDRPGSPG